MNRESEGLEFELSMAAYTTRDADGFYRVQANFFGGAGSQPMEAYHPTGFLGRPRDPDIDPSGDPKLGATVLHALDGSQTHGILLNDPRIMSRLPEVKRGGSLQYGYTDSHVAYTSFDGDTLTWKLVVPAAGGGENTVEVDGESIVIGGGSAKYLVTQELVNWITTELIPKLAAAPGGPITVTAPGGVLTTKTQAS